MATTIIAHCACKNFTHTLHFDTSSLPISRTFCLCNACRQVSGACGISYINVPPSELFDPASKLGLTSYKSSSYLTRYFCSTCGAHTFLTYDVPSVASGISLATGLWDKTEGVIEWGGCMWVSDTLDGGISVWFNSMIEPDGTQRELKRWKYLNRGKDEELVPENELRSLEKKSQSNKLKAQCRCGGVKFYITRPDEASKKARSPFPDLMYPAHLNTNENPNNQPWWLCDDNTKYLAGTCTCTSCRRNLGFEIQTWAFVPKTNIVKEDGSPLDFDLGTLKRYNSSEGVMREFCGTCGATVFWHCDWRPDIIDVSVGILDPEEGARCEGWLEWWTGRVSFEEDAVSRCLVRSLEDGLKAWGAAKGKA